MDFLAGLSAWSKGINTDPGQRTFGKLERKANGSFDTVELVNMLQESTDDVGGKFKVFRISMMAAPERRPATG